MMEFVLLMPLILVLMLMLVDGGMAIDRRIVLQHGVREGGRLGSLAAAPADVEQRTVDESGGLVDAADVEVCYIDGPDGNASAGDAGDTVRVSSSYTYDFTAGSGELMNAFGVTPPTIVMEPSTEFALEAPVAGATSC